MFLPSRADIGDLAAGLSNVTSSGKRQRPITCTRKLLPESILRYC